MAHSRPPKALPRPHKRPLQERSRFTVQAFYGAFVRIWRRGGLDAVSMRAVAEEAGYAVGTLYEYFPNREAMLSGYFRHCLDGLCERIVAADDPRLDWRGRLRCIVAATLDEPRAAPHFDGEMLMSESVIADLAEQRKAFAKLCDTFHDVLAGWPDLPPQPDGVVDTLVITLWGARRYAILLGHDQSGAREVDRTTAMLIALLAP